MPLHNKIASQGPKQRLRALELPKYHGYGSEVSLEVLRDYLWNAERVELFSSERIACLNIRFGELFHRCDEKEWRDFRQFLTAHGISIYTSPWWKFWER